jgi:hypothetical protein
MGKLKNTDYGVIYIKTYRELNFRGTQKQLSEFVEHFNEYAVRNGITE